MGSGRHTYQVDSGMCESERIGVAQQIKHQFQAQSLAPTLSLWLEQQPSGLAVVQLPELVQPQVDLQSLLQL
jgi:hypothetical protein